MSKHSRGAASESRTAGLVARWAIRFTDWSERWYPDSFVFAALALLLVAAADLVMGAAPQDIAANFGGSFWSLVPFTMSMAMVVITGYVVATSGPVIRFIDLIARIPQSGRAAVAFIALVSMAVSLLHYALSLVVGGLLVVALARRQDLRMDYRAAGAAAYLGLGATWALGLGSSAAQMQANAGALPKAIADITGVIPFSQTVGLWQSMALALLLMLVSTLIAFVSAPSGDKVRGAESFGVILSPPAPHSESQRPGDWLERSPIISLLLVLLGGGYLLEEFLHKDALTVISSLDRYNLLFLMLGILLQWRLGNFLRAVARAVPSTGGILIQFPLYGATAALLTQVHGADGQSLSQHLAHLFVTIASPNSFPVVMGLYSGVLGFLVPSGGGKWLIEAPYVMQAAKDLHVHLGWAVQIYNAAEALPNLINPFWMLPLLGIIGLKARDIVGYTVTQFLVHVPLVLFCLWLFAQTLVPV